MTLYRAEYEAPVEGGHLDRLVLHFEASEDLSPFELDYYAMRGLNRIVQVNKRLHWKLVQVSVADSNG